MWDTLSSFVMDGFVSPVLQLVLGVYAILFGVVGLCLLAAYLLSRFRSRDGG